MSEQRVATASVGIGKPGEAFPWQRTFPYKTRPELSKLLDELQASLPGMIEKYGQGEDFWPTFQRAAERISASAMGFNLDFSDRLDAMSAELRSKESGSDSKRRRDSSSLA